MRLSGSHESSITFNNSAWSIWGNLLGLAIGEPVEAAADIKGLPLLPALSHKGI
jgi:hypothetical protein